MKDYILQNINYYKLILFCKNNTQGTLGDEGSFFYFSNKFLVRRFLCQL